MASEGIAERAVLVELPDGRRFHTPHALVDDDGAVLPITPITEVHHV